MAIPAWAQPPVARSWKRDEQPHSPLSRENAWLAAAVLALALYPFLDSWLNIGRVGSIESILVYVILAMGLNIVVGYAGLLDLGYAAFFAFGAYTVGLLTSPSSYFVQRGWVPDWMQHFWPALAVSWMVAAIFGVLLGAPTLRLRGDYLAIVTLGFGEIVPNVFRNAEKFTNGVKGINPIATPTTINIGDRAFRFTSSDQRHWYWLMMAIALFSLVIIRRLYDSRLGRTWQAIREDEIAAASMGVNLVKTKLLAFALGASFAGFAGSVYSSAFQFVDSSQFQFSVSITVLSMIILGGLGNVYGAIIGAFIIGGFDRILTEALNPRLQWVGRHIHLNWLATHDLKQDRFLVFGLALVLMMLLRPGGIWQSAQRKAELSPDTDDQRVQESGSLDDVLRGHNEPAVGEKA